MSSWDHRDKQIVLAREGERLFLSCNLSDSAIGFKALILQNNVFTIRIVLTEVAGANMSEKDSWGCLSVIGIIGTLLSFSPQPNNGTAIYQKLPPS